MNKLNIMEQSACSLTVDYSTVTGRRILPFKFELDLLESNLYPGPGEIQRFCYNITGVGEDTRTYADLSHFVLGICDEITEEQLENVSVIIDGEEQTVIIGDNVEIFNPPATDPQTGCSGLKFDFELDKEDGEMTVCFELNSVYPIGDTEICLYGARRTRKGLSICGPVCNEEPVDEVCPAVGYVPISVCSPVTVTPFTNVLPTRTFCCGSPTVMPGTTSCPGVENGSAEFIISQNICVRVPIEIGATSEVGNPIVEAGDPRSEDICTDCGRPSE